MNSYVYAPKDDYKHRAFWRELYTVEEADHLSGMSYVFVVEISYIVNDFISPTVIFHTLRIHSFFFYDLFRFNIRSKRTGYCFLLRFIPRIGYNIQ